MRIVPSRFPHRSNRPGQRYLVVKIRSPSSIRSKTPEQQALREPLRKAASPSRHRRIVLTNAHEDHCGLARALRDEAKDAEVFVHDWETGHRAGRLEHEESLRLLVRAGVSPDELQLMRKLYNDVRQYADSLEDEHCTPLQDDAELEFETGSLRVLHTPGHTPGSCSFIREADRTVIAGDCVLKRVTPNPILSPDPIDPSRRFRSLAEYLVTCTCPQFAPTLILGGTGIRCTIRRAVQRFFAQFASASQIIRRVPRTAPPPGKSRENVPRRR